MAANKLLWSSKLNEIVLNSSICSFVILLTFGFTSFFSSIFKFSILTFCFLFEDSVGFEIWLIYFDFDAENFLFLFAEDSGLTGFYSIFIVGSNSYAFKLS